MTTTNFLFNLMLESSNYLIENETIKLAGTDFIIGPAVDIYNKFNKTTIGGNIVSEEYIDNDGVIIMVIIVREDKSTSLPMKFERKNGYWQGINNKNLIVKVK